MTDFKASRQYPVYAATDGVESAFSRYMELPTVEDLRSVALFGMARYADPQTFAEIDDAFLARFLISAISEIEMKEGITITPTEFSEPFDFTEGAGDYMNPHNGWKLTKWPATQILNLAFKYPHTEMTSPQLEYIVPAEWVALRENRISIIAGRGSPTITGGGGGLAARALGAGRGTYRPAQVQVRYVAGFDPGRVPGVLVDLILTLASIRLLNDVAPILFPHTSVNNSIDGVSQSAQIGLQGFIQNRVGALEKKYTQQASAIKGAFGRLIKMSFFSSGG